MAIHESMPPIFSSVDDAEASASAPIDLPDTVTTCESVQVSASEASEGESWCCRQRERQLRV